VNAIHAQSTVATRDSLVDRLLMGRDPKQRPKQQCFGYRLRKVVPSEPSWGRVWATGILA
jgi:hypothetical protein